MSAILAVLANTVPSGHTLDVTITTPGGDTYSPPDWLIGLEATIQCWGAGADGTTDGGGGGEFAQSNFTFAGGVDYRIDSVADGYGATTWDRSNTGAPAANSASGASGGTGGTGDVTYDGGDGAGGGTATTRGGGGAAGTTEVGGNGSNLGGGGGGGFEFGGNGGAAGQNGVQPGGGGGADDGVSTGLGAAGMIRIIYPAI